MSRVDPDDCSLSNHADFRKSERSLPFLRALCALRGEIKTQRLPEPPAALFPVVFRQISFPRRLTLR